MAKLFMNRVRSGQRSACAGCGLHFQLLILLPCVHLLCVECLLAKCGGLNNISKDSTFQCPMFGCRGYAKRERSWVDDPQSQTGKRAVWRQVKWNGKVVLDDVQKLQPGVELQWAEALAERENDRINRQRQIIAHRQQQQRQQQQQQQQQSQQPQQPWQRWE